MNYLKPCPLVGSYRKVWLLLLAGFVPHCAPPDINPRQIRVSKLLKLLAVCFYRTLP